jgi:formate dehydrogenase subunit gamma
MSFPQNHSGLKAIIDRHVRKKGPLLPILRDVQEEFECVSPDAEAVIAQALNLSRAEVHGVVSFYHDLSPTPDLRPCVELCRAEACKARGVEALLPAAQAVAGDRVNLKSVYCLGLCATGPNARIGDALHSRLDKESLVKLVLSI